ncbi:hypothetical protein AX13_07385 [Comamonas aquatica DA1877]|uniref:Uncharacterized protein n=1 Tax=Comamonas aquatica DA1877 TaxID=1457173 RepID=A0A014NQ56_9BURK|nr:hypothetical protein AX13_07385 [Comamonas aquatica DA1877]
MGFDLIKSSRSKKSIEVMDSYFLKEFAWLPISSMIMFLIGA